MAQAKLALLLVATASAFAAPVMAQAPTTVPGVVVQGETKKVIEQQARRFTEAYAAPTEKIGQIARWHEAVCVKVEGVIPAQADKIRARVEEVAKDVGLTVRKPGCLFNIQIVFTPQPQGYVDQVAKRDEGYLGFHYRGELNKVKAVTRPIQSWYVTATEGGLGHNAATIFAIMEGPSGPKYNPNPDGMPGQTRAAETLDVEDNATPTGCADAPQFTSCLRSAFRNALVVVDSRAVEGKSLGAVSDYVAMLALSQPKSLDGCNALASVIDLFAKAPCPGRDAPDGFTPTDAAFLTALYQIDPEAKKNGEIGDISARLAGILIGAQQPSR